jgi:hypothetical protein
MAKKGKRAKRREEAAASSGKLQPSAPLAAPPPVEAAIEASLEHSAAAAAAPGGALASAATSTGRMLANALIVAFLAYQIAMPLRYYLGGRGYDERFSWRMFSTLRMQKCRVQVRETVDGEERPLVLKKELQVAWIGMLERYRRGVVDKVLQRRCERAGASRVAYTRSCTDTDGSALPDNLVSLDCKSGAFSVENDAPPDDSAEVAP